MSFFVPVLIVGALAGVALAGEVRTVAAAAPQHEATPVTAGPLALAEASAENAMGVGSYLKGAVADLDGNPTTALQGYLNALGEDSANIELRRRTLELALMAGDVPNAIRLARSLPDVEQTTMTRLVRVVDAAHEGRINESRKLAREVSKVSPELLQFRLMQVYLDYGSGKDVPKLIAWLDSDGLPPSMSGRRSYHVARLWLKAGEPAKALDALKQAALVEPGSVATTLLLGQTLARQGEPGAGAAVFDSFRAANPSLAALVPAGKTLLTDMPRPFASTLDEDMASVMTDFGLLVWAQGAYGPARQVLNLSLWLNPQDVHTRYYTGMLLEMGGDLAVAQAEYAKLLGDEVPEGVRLAAHIRMAEVQFQQGDMETPWKALRKLVKTYPDELNLMRSLAQMAYAREDYRDAITYYTRLLELMPASTPPAARMEVLFARGVAHERREDIDKASDDMLEALKIDPANAQILNYLGYMWVDDGRNIEEAFALLQKAHTLQPDDGAITDSLGWAYYMQGDYVSAQAYLERATEQDPESPEIYDHLGDAYRKLGETDKAVREWQRAIDLLDDGKEGPDAGFRKRVERKLR
jgi:tetratricopeptide (TPR) repeat protein